MRTLIGNLFGSSAPSAETIGWWTSVVVHAIGAVVGVFHVAWGPVERPAPLGLTTSVELAARWVPPEDAAPAVRITPIDVADVVPAEEIPPSCFETTESALREHSPLETCVCQPAIELAMAGDPTALRAPAAPKQSDAALPERRLLVVDSPPALPPRRTAASVPDVEARPVAPAKPVAAPSEQRPGDTTAAAVDQLPRKLATNPTPSYPPDAYARRQQGRVLLEVRLNERGVVEDISVWQSSGVASLDRAALEAVRQWRFEPARRDGKPVPIVVTVPVRFSIEGR